MRRRGFSLLELTLATMVGAMVLAAALGVFTSMDRGDAVLAKRARENLGLEAASRAIERAMGTLVMESAGQSQGTMTGASKGAEGKDPKLQSQPSGRARFLLETDTTAALPGMPDIAAPAGGTAGSASVMTGTLSSPQRLELVVAQHPVAVNARPEAVVPVAKNKEKDSKEGSKGADEPAESRPVAVRGAFDLRPEPARPGADDAGTTWTLWWRPIERRVDDTGNEAFFGADDLAVPLATGLKSARWSVYYEQSWETEHATAAVLDLPAYVKLQLTTATGMQADWLFEVAWSMGPEFKTTQSSEDEEAGAAEDELNGDQGTEVPGTTTSPGAAGGPGQGTSARPMGPPTRVKPGAAQPPVKKPPPPKTPTQPSRPSGGPSGTPAGRPR